MDAEGDEIRASMGYVEGDDMKAIWLEVGYGDYSVDDCGVTRKGAQHSQTELLPFADKTDLRGTKDELHEMLNHALWRIIRDVEFIQDMKETKRLRG